MVFLIFKDDFTYFLTYTIIKIYHIEWQNKAVRQLEKIKDRMAREMIWKAVEKLRYFPSCSQVKLLQNHRCAYRLRVGRFRILFNVDEVVDIISIEEVKKRDENTY